MNTPTNTKRSSREEMRRIVRPILALLAGACVTCVSSLHAADWPQWRFDANRSAATEESCTDNPSQLWHLALPYPDPAYDHQYRMCADITYAPVAAHGLVFIPSNVADQVLACDLKSGKTVWRHITDGPVRMAPACTGDTVCFGSDDGYLYAVAARTGELRWKVRGAPDHLPDSRLLVNGRLCSRWPVRGAPVIHGNAVFFGAGVWPEEGVYVSAVDVRTGNLLWRSDKLSYIKNGMSDHGRAYDLSLPPQGYPAVLDGKLAVTSGRSLAAWFDLETGRTGALHLLLCQDQPAARHVVRRRDQLLLDPRRPLVRHPPRRGPAAPGNAERLGIPALLVPGETRQRALRHATASLPRRRHDRRIRQRELLQRTGVDRDHRLRFRVRHRTQVLRSARPHACLLPRLRPHRGSRPGQSRRGQARRKCTSASEGRR